MIGLHRDRFIDYNPSKLYHVVYPHKLLVPTATAEGRANTNAAINLRHLFRKQYELESTSKPKENDKFNIVVQKRSGVSRSITNHDEMMSALKQTFPNVHITEYDSTVDTVDEMIKKHYFADLLIGPHGAGLSNQMFMKQNSSTLEIYMKTGMLGSADWYNPCHKITAERLGINYHVIRSLTGSHGSSLTVNVTQVVENVRNIMKL